MRMSKLTKLASVIAAGAIATVVFATGCSTEPVAATVNGEKILESTITDYVEDFRATNDLTDDQAWAQWMVDNGRDAASVREDAISYFVDLELIDQEADKNGITVSDEEVNSQYEEIKQYYTDNSEDFDSQLAQMGYTEESYKNYLRQSLLREALTEAVVAQDAVSEDEVLETTNAYATILDGSKKIRTIVAGNKEAAEEIKKRLDGGEDFEAVADEVSNSGEYDGWTALINVDQTIYSAIDGAKKGDVTDIIPSDDESRYYIVKVTDVLNVDPDKGFAKASDIPEDIYADFEQTVSQSTATTEFDTYLQGVKDSSDIVINPMPEGLPYDVSTEGVSGDGESATEEEGNDEGEVVETDVTVDENGNEVAVDETATEEAPSDGTDSDAADTADTEAETTE